MIACMKPSDSAGPGSPEDISVRAHILARRINVRPLKSAVRLSPMPLTLKVGEAGLGIFFRYGVVVLMNVPDHEADAFIQGMSALFINPFSSPIAEDVLIRVDPSRREGPEEGLIYVHETTLERYQVVAEILAKSLVLEYYENRVAQELDQIEPLAVSLREKGRYGPKGRHLLQLIGGTLLSLQDMVGRAAVSEKPDLLWDHPELERFYGRLEDEYEIRERQVALERKMQLVSRTAETVLELLQARRTLRVEWYIVLLIVVEIILTLYEMFLRT